MNIILMIFDSLRKDCVGFYGTPPWGKVHTPNFDAFAKESMAFTKVYPEALPTLPARRAIYTGNRVYPFHNSDFRLLKGDFVGAPAWGPIPEDQPTLAEMLKKGGYRTALIADVYHMFKPSKNYWRGFDQWMFLRGREVDASRSGPRLTQAELDYWLPVELQKDPSNAPNVNMAEFLQSCIINIRDRTKEEDYFAPRVLREASLWLEQNRDADKFFLTIESFDPHEPWLVPPHYRDMYLKENGREQVLSWYQELPSSIDWKLIERTRANYSGSVTQCDRWFGYLMESLRVQGLLDNTMVILTSDHGHSIGDGNYLGKRGYPSSPEVYDIPLMIRFPHAEHAGVTSDVFVQHHDIGAQILETALGKPPVKVDGIPFLKDAIANKTGQRDHVTVAWGSVVTVITDRWWLNCKVDGTGVLLYDLKAAKPFAGNVAEKHADVVKQLFAKAKEDARGGIPDWLMDLAKSQSDAPGCSALASRA